MKKLGKKRLLITMIVLIISLFLTTAVFASGFYKKISAYYNNIKIYHNGKLVNIEKKLEPFIVNIEGKSKTFVPVRYLGEILDKEVKWDQKTYSVNIVDKPDQELANIKFQSSLKDIKIEKLEKQVKELEAKLAEAEKGTVSKNDLFELEEYLNEEYGYHEKIDFDIRLTEYRDGIEVSIVVDLGRDSSRWDDLSDRDIEYFVEDIVKEIQYDFKDIDVTGDIEDRRTRDKLIDFYTDSRGRVVIDINKGSSYIRDLDDMEYELNREFGYYERIRFDIKLSGSESSIMVEIEVDEEDWIYLRNWQQEEYLEDIYKAIADNFPKAKVYGYVDDYKAGEINSFEFDSRGYVTIK